MVMCDEEEVWKLKVSVRVKRFKLKLLFLQNRFSFWKLHRLSFLVRFRKHHLKIESQSAKPKPKSRFGFLRSFLILRRREVKSEKKFWDWNPSNKAIIGMPIIENSAHYPIVKKPMNRTLPYPSILSSEMAGIISTSFCIASSFPNQSLRISSRTNRFSRIYALSSNDIKVGTSIEVDGAPWRVLEFLHVKPGKGAAFVRTKIRNYVNGSTVERTFRAGITIEEANVFKETKQFTYKDGSQFVFMDLSTYEEIRLNEGDMGEKTKWLKEGMDCNLLYWKDKVIDFELPITVQLKIVDVDPGLRGDTAQGGTKPATLETGAVVNVPLFVNVGEDIMVDTRTGTYMSRV